MNRYLIATAIMLNFSAYSIGNKESQKSAPNTARPNEYYAAFLKHIKPFSIGMAQGSVNYAGKIYLSPNHNQGNLNLITFACAHGILAQTRQNPLPEVSDLSAMGVGQIAGDLLALGIHNYLCAQRHDASNGSKYKNMQVTFSINNNLAIAAIATIAVPIWNEVFKKIQPYLPKSK